MPIIPTILLYRLIDASGREHIGQAGQPQTTWSDEFRVKLAHPNDGQKMRNYFEDYEYDVVGNMKRYAHYASGRRLGPDLRV